MRVLFLLTNPIQSPGERYRVFQFLPLLKDLGVDAEVDCLFRSEDYDIVDSPSHSALKAFLLARGFGRRLATATGLREFDLIHMYRLPVLPIPGGLEGWLKRKDIPYVFDLDDAIYLDPPEPLNRFSRVLRSPKRVPRSIASAALTTAGNPHLADFARQHSSRVAMVPTCVDLDRFTPRDARNSASVTVGWMGSRSTAPYLKLLDEPLRLLTEELPQTTLRVVGGDYRADGVRIERLPWSLTGEVAELHRFDVGVMPLPDDPWARGKTGLKVLQYMACGVPVVASPVGVNRDIIKDGHNGFLASDDKEWHEKLSILATDPDMWRRFSKEGRKTAAEGYSLHHWAPRLRDMFEQALESHRERQL